MKALTHQYYEAWAAQEVERVRDLLHRDLVFISPQDRFDSSDSFLSACWKYSIGLAAVRFVKEIYDAQRAFVILQWKNEDGSTFAGAEYLEIKDGKIKEIIVVSNDSQLDRMIG